LHFIAKGVPLRAGISDDNVARRTHPHKLVKLIQVIDGTNFSELRKIAASGD
jgi:hypothetical protein